MGKTRSLARPSARLGGTAHTDKKVNLALIDSIARRMQLSGAKRKRGSSVCKRMCLECNQKEYTGTGTTLRPIGNWFT